MQCPAIMAFRKRLKSFGYLNVSICQKKVDGKIVPGVYVVSAVEPLAGIPVSAEYSVGRMAHSFR